MFAGILGGRIYYVLFNWEFYQSALWEVFTIWKGGLAIHGGPHRRRAGRLSLPEKPHRLHLGVRRRGGARHHAGAGVRAFRQLHERRCPRRADGDALGRGVSDDLHRGPGVSRTGDAPRDDIRASPEPPLVFRLKALEAHEPQAGLHLLPLLRPLLLGARRRERLPRGQPLVRARCAPPYLASAVLVIIFGAIIVRRRMWEQER